jgi:hypothetical protein
LNSPTIKYSIIFVTLFSHPFPSHPSQHNIQPHNSFTPLEAILLSHIICHHLPKLTSFLGELPHQPPSWSHINPWPF